MPTFTYSARDNTGKVVEETIEANSKEALLTLLRNRGLSVASVEEVKA